MIGHPFSVTDRRIDRLVYEPYGFAEEIRAVQYPHYISGRDGFVLDNHGVFGGPFPHAHKLV